MSSQRIPTYRHHKQSGQAIVTLTDGQGGRRDVLLGEYGTKTSREAYARSLAEWEATGRRLPRSLAAAELTIGELILAFWKHAQGHYRQVDGKATGELKEFRLSLKALRVLYSHTHVSDFGPLALKTLREAMINGSYLTDQQKADRRTKGHPLRLSRGVVNQRIGRIRRLFRWGVENELVPSSVLHGLEAVKGLERGRSDARETEPIKPVPVEFVEATLPFLLPTVADMVMLQLHTGMRPGEVCQMRACDIDMIGPVWLYRPEQHKTAHRGHRRLVPIGPRAQIIVRRRLKTDPRAYLFSPRDAVAEKRQRDRLARKTKIYPSERSNKRMCPKLQPGDFYATTAYTIAIRRAIKKANAAAAAQGRQAIPHWHPHQLRHSKATEIRREAGLDAARAVLGHRSPVVTEVYAELDLQKAVDVAARLG